MQKLENGAIWYDTNGDVIHAHGGHMLHFGGVYYWYGENRTDNNYVSCYRSKDLINWEFRNNILTIDSKTSPHRMRTNLSLKNESGGKVNLERPKVLYNKITKKFVLWVHFENGIDYHCAAAAIASCDSPDGDFIYHGSFNPYGYMSRDCTLFQDVDDTAYFVSAARDNADLHVYRLTDDYMNVEKLVNQLWQGEHREAPALLKKDGIYYMLTSGCTGWAPNQGEYSVSKSIEGKWSILQNFGDETTYQTQPAFVLPIASSEGTRYIYVSDRWDGKDYYNSRYVFLTINFEAGNKLSIDFCEEFKG